MKKRLSAIILACALSVTMVGCADSNVKDQPVTSEQTSVKVDEKKSEESASSKDVEKADTSINTISEKAKSFPAVNGDLPAWKGICVVEKAEFVKFRENIAARYADIDVNALNFNLYNEPPFFATDHEDEVYTQYTAIGEIPDKFTFYVVDDEKGDGNVFITPGAEYEATSGGHKINIALRNITSK